MARGTSGTTNSLDVPKDFQSHPTSANLNRLTVALLDRSHENAIKMKFMCFESLELWFRSEPLLLV